MKQLFAISLVLLTTALSAQSYSFRSYSVEHGLAHPFIYDITQDDNGYLWIATGDGLSKFNGFKFNNYYPSEGLTEGFVSTLFNDSKNRLWLGHKEGGCTVLENNKFTSIESGQHFNSLVRAIREDQLGNIWLLSQHSGMIMVDDTGNLSPFKTMFAQLLLFDFQITNRGQLLLATNEGLFLYGINNKTSQPEFIRFVEDIPLTRINCIDESSTPGKYYVGTEDEGVYAIQVRNNHNIIVEEVAPELNLHSYNVQSILEDSDKSLWIGTFGSGLIHLAHHQKTSAYSMLGQFNEQNGLESADVKTLFRDREGNIWAGKFGGSRNAGGISSLNNNAFVYYNRPDKTDASFSAIHVRGNKYCFGLEGEVMVVDSGDFTQPAVYGKIHGLPEGTYTGVFTDPSGTVWAGNIQHGLFYKAATDTIFKPFELSKDRLSMAINDLTGDEEKIWIATKNGIYSIRQSDKSIAYFNQQNGLEHNVVKSVFLDESGNLWYCTVSAYLSYIKNGNIVNVVISEDQRVHDQVSITKDNQGNIWLATNGSGVFIFDYENIRTINNESHGLKSNFCYSIAVDYQNKVWIGHKGGMSCYNPSGNQLSILDQDDGMFLDFQPNAAFVDERGELWFGTDKKLVRYSPAKDAGNSIPPIVNIENIYINDEKQKSHDLKLEYGHYKARFEFLGLSFRKSNEVTYQYILEGHDQDWHELSDYSEAYYSKVDPGQYTFKVVAYNSDGVKSLGAAEVKLFIEKPFWQKAWFIGLGALAFVVLTVSLLKLRDRRQRLIRQYLKKTLDMRTKEVQAKSKELERKNKDITASIHYAKKIQDATLPNQGKLRDVFPDSFIYYKPRDIVSGDFYWFKQFGNKLLISVADCTGHGVPGALLSMIGSTKISSIAGKQEVRSPDEVMRQLDEELRLVLQQTNMSGSPQDGMDIAVCEIDLDTRYLRLCSAMTHVYISTRDGIEKIPGDRNSIGGNHLGREKQFTMHHRQMLPGETLFLSTDGYQDQFGGQEGKKLKRSGFIQLLKSLGSMDSPSQAVAINQHFTSWKNQHDQIDDVLVIGLKF